MLRKRSVIMAVVLTLALLIPLEAAVLSDSANAAGRGPVFTAQEESYISSHPTLKIGYVQDRIPVSFTKDGELAGISRYIFDRISRVCGIDFEYVPLPANGDVTYDYLISEGLDLVSSVEYNEENLSANGILMSKPYLSSRKVVVAKEGLEFSYGANLSIAITTGSQTLRKVMNRLYPNFELVDYPSISACLDAVRSGEADLMMQNQYVVEHWIAKPIYENLQVIPVLGMADEMCFSAVVAFGDHPGPSAEDGGILIGILNKVIDTMTEDEVGTYIIEAVMENQYEFTISDFMYQYRYTAILLLAALAVILLLMVLLTRQRIRYAEDRANTKVRAQFLSTMSHEIRTPLNGLVGLNYLMSQKLDDRGQLEYYLEQSTVTARYLLSLVNDILDMSKLQEQKVELAIRPFDMGLLLNTVDSIVKKGMEDKGIQYNVSFDVTTPNIQGDEARIQQVLLNLLDNARKFTPGGGRVDFSLRQEPAGRNRVTNIATVADTGCGMSEEFQKHIYDVFTQELGTVSKGNQGTGLGLAISRNLVRLMDGDLDFVSRMGEGTTFTFRFTTPVAQAAPEKPAPLAERDTETRRRTNILIAEDNELNGEILRELLEGEGYEVDLAENGRIALEKFSRTRPGECGVILMDLMMPEMDGYEAARAIRGLDRPDAGTVRIFACTANAFPQDRERAMAAGMDEFITKPVDVDELMRKIEGEQGPSD